MLEPLGESINNVITCEDNKIISELSEYKFENYVFTKSPDIFFRWCLRNRLYKVSRDPKFVSRMKKYYKSEINFTGLSCVVAYHNTKPVGIILCEHQNTFTHAKTYYDPVKWVLKVKDEFTWGFQQIGMVNIFVKSAHRKQGIARLLVRKIEDLRLSQMVNAGMNLDSYSVPLFQARQLALDIVLKYSQYSYVSENKPKEFLYPNTIHGLTKGLIELRRGERFPIFPLPAKVRLQKELFLNNPVKFSKSFQGDGKVYPLTKKVSTKLKEIEYQREESNN